MTMCHLFDITILVFYLVVFARLCTRVSNDIMACEMYMFVYAWYLV
jgi:hypothetical protein